MNAVGIVPYVGHMWEEIVSKRFQKYAQGVGQPATENERCWQKKRFEGIEEMFIVVFLPSPPSPLCTPVG